MRDDASTWSRLGEGMTPLLPTAARTARRIGVPGLLMKDEGLMPTGSFKARGAAVGVSRARELGVTGVAMPTNGNAGAAWALYAARAGHGEPDRDAGRRAARSPGRVRRPPAPSCTWSTA